MSKTTAETPWFDYPKFNWGKKKAIVIGGGIAACQSAWHLAQTGWQVTLIERHEKLATEASGNIAGAILPKMTAQQSLGEDFYTQAFLYTLNQLQQLSKSGKEIKSDLCGVLQLAHNPREEKRWESLKLRNFDNDFLQCLDETQTLATSGINTPYKSTYIPQGGWVNPASFCEALIDSPDCTVILNQEALSLKKQQDDWQVLDSNQQLIAEAEVVVIANGRDLNQFEQSEYLPYMPVLGQTTQSTASEVSDKLKTVIGHEGYLTPAVDGQLIFGATFERNISDAVIKPESDQINQQQLHKYLPEFSDALVDVKSSHAGIRVTTPDRFPYAGAIIDSDYFSEEYGDIHQGKHWKQYSSAQYLDGLFVLGGLGSRGLTTGGYCAAILADIINGKQPNDTITKALHPARFAIKRLKQNSSI